MTNNGLQSITQKTKDRAPRTPLATFSVWNVLFSHEKGHTKYVFCDNIFETHQNQLEQVKPLKDPNSPFGFHFQVFFIQFSYSSAMGKFISFKQKQTVLWIVIIMKYTICPVVSI